MGYGVGSWGGVRRREGGVVEMQMGPMIDMVFLLLVFFMVTAESTPREGSLQAALPGEAAQEAVVSIPDRLQVAIAESGEVLVNERVVGAAGAVRTCRPSLKTVTRSASSRTSSSRCEI